MDTIINELISYDRQARAIIEEALQAKEKSEKELPEEAKRLYDDFLSRAKDRVARIQESVQSDHEEEIGCAICGRNCRSGRRIFCCPATVT